MTVTMLVGGLLLVGSSGPTTADATDPATYAVHPGSLEPAIELSIDEENELVRRYCTRCHNDRRMTGNLSLASFDAGEAVAQAETAEKMIRKLRLGMMPPPGSRKPTGDSLTALAAAMEGRIDAAFAEAPSPGRRSFQRLTRAEYAASVEDLLGLKVDVDAFLPTETLSNNFDNIADVQNPSATLMEGYLRAASHVAHLAVGDPNATATSVTYKVPRTASQVRHVEGAPIGTRGGVSVEHTFPADGEYRFQIELHPTPTGYLFGRTTPGEQIEISIDGERVAVFEIDRWMNESDPTGMRMRTPPIRVQAGPRRLTAAFIQQIDGPVDDLLTPVDHSLADTQIGEAYGVTTLPHLRDLVVLGPTNVTGVSDTPLRRRIFSCRPIAPDEERPCARSIVERLAERAYRRPLDDTDIDDLMRFYQIGAIEGGFEGGVRTALQAVLASPHFVFRLEEVPAEAQPGVPFRISDLDLASRLSFFLWAAPPDDALIEAAQSGELRTADGLDAQIERMLADDRSEALGSRFASQWLRLQDLEKLHPDAQLYPYYDQTLAESMRSETELFFWSLIAEDRSFFDMFTADYTYVDERLAKHYEIPNVIGPEFRRVGYPDERRRGLFGHGSILAMTSHANRTSPVLRGKWVMEVLLGSPPPPPPPGVPDLEETEATTDGRLLTVRERMEEHRKNPACTSCHKMMDPIGLAFENFDVTGAYRIKDEGMPIDAVGELYDGTEIGSPADLRAALLQRPEPLARVFAENMMAFALGRRVLYSDQPIVRQIVREAAKDDYKVTAFIRSVVHSPAFQMSVIAETTEN